MEHYSSQKIYRFNIYFVIRDIIKIANTGKKTDYYQHLINDGELCAYDLIVEIGAVELMIEKPAGSIGKRII